MMVSPDQWFAQAATVGLGAELELSAVANALTALPVLPKTTYRSVNVGPDALYDARLQALVASAAASRVRPTTTARDTVAALRKAGARLAIDDAGAGYSSLRRIVDLGPDIIKLDQTLVRGAHLRPARRAVLRAFVPLADDLHATLVWEGIEELVEERALRQWGLCYAQGWLYGWLAALHQVGLGFTVPRQRSVKIV